jgi:hypothetical protein
LRDDIARGDGVDTDIIWTPFAGEVARELDDGGFGGVVGGTDEALDIWVSLLGIDSVEIGRG